TEGSLKEEMGLEETFFNSTTPHISPSNHKPGFPGFYALIPFVLLMLIGCVVAMVFYIRRRARLDELRHRLIPLYSYDPAEGPEDWRGDGREYEELTHKGKSCPNITSQCLPNQRCSSSRGHFGSLHVLSAQ
ncbi:hypothetical protein L3Q82_023812, partial [Scortum barcoo]